MLKCLIYVKHLPNSSNNSFKMLPVLGKFTDLNNAKITKNHSNKPYFEQNVSSLRQMLLLLKYWSICLKLLTFFEILVHWGKCSSIYMEEHLPKSTVIFKNWPNLSKKSQSVVVGKCSSIGMVEHLPKTTYILFKKWNFRVVFGDFGII